MLHYYKEAAVTRTVDYIRSLGLKVAPAKTEAMIFHRPRQGPPPSAHITVEGVRIKVGAQMKYLGLTLDGRWTFCAHFRLLQPRIVKTAAALGRLLPNVGGPSVSCRKLYAGVTRCMALYGAPIWFPLQREAKHALRQPQRILALRAIRAYRTVALDEWMERRHGHLTYRLVQVLTGHGAFGWYLHHIARREPTPECHGCGAVEDTVDHTLVDCPAWVPQRRALVSAVGVDLSPPSIVKAMLGSETAWKGMATFCEEVMSQKEAAERVREEDPLADPIRRSRRGRRRRQYATLLHQPLAAGP
ncbi:uncharacterized protein LOC135080824 [Ostrinia nubilalis]|uniref:uncharacterized protein LOC135080824 n=1 Tax=Ostrinia nubilalis TaxID=29057 RepID=UPI0030824814